MPPAATPDELSFSIPRLLSRLVSSSFSRIDAEAAFDSRRRCLPPSAAATRLVCFRVFEARRHRLHAPLLIIQILHAISYFRFSRFSCSFRLSPD